MALQRRGRTCRLCKMRFRCFHRARQYVLFCNGLYPRCAGSTPPPQTQTMLPLCLMAQWLLPSTTPLVNCSSRQAPWSATPLFPPTPRYVRLLGATQDTHPVVHPIVPPRQTHPFFTGDDVLRCMLHMRCHHCSHSCGDRIFRGHQRGTSCIQPPNRLLGCVGQ